MKSMMKSMLKARSVRPLTNERGAHMIEYTLVASLISVVAIAAATLVGVNVTGIFNAVAAAL